MYAGLTTDDKPALLDAIANDGEWIVRTPDNLVWSNSAKPVRYGKSGDWNQLDGRMHIIGGIETLTFIKSNDSEPVNSYLALAQIAEMESKQNNALSEKASEKGCLTWNERINQMSADEKGEFFATFNCIESIQPGYDCSQHENCKECMIAFFASPYTEGETDER